MSVVIRLARGGQKKRPFYRVVVAEKAARRDGKFIEVVGTYNPMLPKSAAVASEAPVKSTSDSSAENSLGSPVLRRVKLEIDRIKYWISVGAETTPKVREFILKEAPGYLEGVEGGRLAKLQASRKARKSRLAAKAA